MHWTGWGTVHVAGQKDIWYVLVLLARVLDGDGHGGDFIALFFTSADERKTKPTSELWRCTKIERLQYSAKGRANEETGEIRVQESRE